MFDIDHFKQVNDNQGHAAGDAVLRVIAQRLQSTLRATDVACRYGGEEFVVILPGADVTAAGIIAERVRQTVARTQIEAEPPIAVTISLGITASDDVGSVSGGMSAKLLACADAALYQAKQAGRNRVCRYQPSLRPAT
jgi:diguanylate cyclase (GGDEF)-like protein